MSAYKLFSAILPKKPPVCYVVIAAAGSSQRCNGEDKLLYKINGKPVLAYSIDAFENSQLVSEIVIVTRTEQLELITDMCREYGFKKVKTVLAGGETRMQSVCNGVFGVSKKAKLIAIHDGARPCISRELIEQTVCKAAQYHAAAPGIPVSSTIKRVSGTAGSSFGQTISETVNREDLVEIQTPQIFRAEIIKAALTKASGQKTVLTDDCMAAELIGVPVHIVPGERRNIKITENIDLKIARALLELS